VRIAEPLLRVDPQLGEQDVPAVAQELSVIHRFQSLEAKTPGPAGRFAVGASGPSYCGFACAETDLVEAMTGNPLS
jgi:hypothetical protein